MVVKNGRALHFVLKIADRTLTAKFYRDILGMKVLRHEEFTQGCEAACNGPYDNRWSKTMVGYGPEDSHFAVELTYNYSVNAYTLGNDFLGITIKSQEAISRAKVANWPLTQENGQHVVQAPGGYKFFLLDEPQPTDEDPVQNVILASSNIQKTIKYWKSTLGMIMYGQEADKQVLLGYGPQQTKIQFQHVDGKVEHETAYGRIAFAVPQEEQLLIDKAVRSAEDKYTILKPLISLDTPGKATVTVEILADPDGHEICFVDDENFRKLSVVDPTSDAELDKYIKKDEARKMKQ